MLTYCIQFGQSLKLYCVLSLSHCELFCGFTLCYGFHNLFTTIFLTVKIFMHATEGGQTVNP